MMLIVQKSDIDPKFPGESFKIPNKLWQALESTQNDWIM